MPRASFLLPFRDAEATLAEAVESLLAQTEADHEVLLFDDGSTDRGLDVASRFASADRRVRIVGSNRVGLVEALRRLVAAASADLLARMDADDWSHPRRLEAQVSLLEARPDLAAVSCLVECFPAEAVRPGMRRYERWVNGLVTPEDIARDIYVESPLVHPSVTMRREAYERVGGYVDDGLPEDYGLWLRMHDLGFAMAKVPEVLFRWRERGSRLTRTDPRYSAEAMARLKLRHLLRGPLASREAISVWGAGHTGRSWAKRLEESGIRVAAFVDVSPRLVGRTLRGARILEPADLARGAPAGFVLVAVGAPGAREEIRDFLSGLGISGPSSCVFVA